GNEAVDGGRPSGAIAGGTAPGGGAAHFGPRASALRNRTGDTGARRRAESMARTDAQGCRQESTGARRGRYDGRAARAPGKDSERRSGSQGAAGDVISAAGGRTGAVGRVQCAARGAREADGREVRN